jgi:hypothetical protein
LKERREEMHSFDSRRAILVVRCLPFILLEPNWRQKFLLEVRCDEENRDLDWVHFRGCDWRHRVNGDRNSWVRCGASRGWPHYCLFRDSRQQSQSGRLLAEGPPANYGLVYVHRPSGVGGLAVGFTVSLDSVDVAFLRLSRFTRVVVAPGGHQMRVGLKKQNVGTVANTQGCETSFTLSAGETAVFGMKYGGAR